MLGPVRFRETQALLTCSCARSALKKTLRMATGRADAEAAPIAQQIRGLGPLAPKFKGVLLDQFGVLHDGKSPYPGAVQSLQKLHEAGMKMVVLSNSSQRAEVAYKRLESMGFCREWLTGIVTSGELTYSHLLNRPDSSWKSLGSRCLHITWSSRGRVLLQGLDLQLVSSPEDAEFILVHGTDALSDGTNGEPMPRTMDEIRDLLKRCCTKGGVQMVVANPDLVTVDGDELKVMPGSLGAEYEAMGGDVTYMGKPSPIVYRASLEMLDLAESQVIAVGDSMEHDIKGASDFGIASVLVGGGIHAADLRVSRSSDSIDDDALRQFCQQQGVHPTFAMTYFKY